MLTHEQRTDGEIQRAVSADLDRDAPEMGLGVAADNGIVTLTGTVSSWRTRMAAEETALRVTGVSDVLNEIAVRSPESRNAPQPS
jgi:osmotically-inducible protein OsmY